MAQARSKQFTVQTVEHGAGVVKALHQENAVIWIILRVLFTAIKFWASTISNKRNIY